MFKKVRRNFIIITTLSVALILTIGNVISNVINFNNQVAASDQIIALIEKQENALLNINESVIGDSRYFTVTYKDDGKVLKVNLEHVDTQIVTYDIATQYMNAVKDKKEDRGYKDVYRYHITRRTDNNKVVFLNCQRSIANNNLYMTISIFSSIGLLILFFILIFFGSKYVLKPVKDSYDKQNRFITNASHELKTPLAIISNNNELIEMKKGKNQYSASINRQISRMNTLIKDLSSLAKIKEYKHVVFEDVDISTLTNLGVKNLKLETDKQNIKLVRYISKDLHIIANNEYVTHIISIMLDNARKYAKSYIDITLLLDKDTVMLKVKNDNDEVEDGDLTKYTERFFRKDNVRASKEGSGIGLSILEELVNLIKAKLNIYGLNKTFNIEISFSNKNKISNK